MHVHVHIITFLQVCSLRLRTRTAGTVALAGTARVSNGFPGDATEKYHQASLGEYTDPHPCNNQHLGEYKCSQSRNKSFMTIRLARSCRCF